MVGCGAHSAFPVRAFCRFHKRRSPETRPKRIFRVISRRCTSRCDGPNVVLNSVISDTGCVKGARAVHSVHPTIDLAAMNAVAQWRFSPTRLDAQAVPVLMTVTVNFTLQ